MTVTIVIAATMVPMETIESVRLGYPIHSDSTQADANFCLALDSPERVAHDDLDVAE